MGEFLKPEQVIGQHVSLNPYLRAIQVANRLGLMGIRIEEIDRTFPLGISDLLCAIPDEEATTIAPIMHAANE